MASGVIALAGFDVDIVARLEPAHARFFAVSGTCTLMATIVVGVGAGYGADLVSDSVPVGIATGIGFALVFLNLYRLFHAGTGFPIHWPIEALEHWSPSLVGVAVFVGLGALLSQPDVLLVMKPIIDDAVAKLPVDGLVARTRTAWTHPSWVVVSTVLFTLLSSLPAWLRRLALGPVRAYEQQRWLDERMLVDDAFADAQDAITRLLDRTPGFSGRLQIHYADPPYNTRPLVFGFDLFAVRETDNRYFARGDEPAPPPPPETAAPPRLVGETPAPVHLPPLAVQVVAEAAPSLQWDDPQDDDNHDAPVPMFFVMGRAQVKRARQHIDEVAPFIARFVDQPEQDIRRLLQAAPPEARLHEVIPAYKSLRSIILKDAGFALDHGLAPILAIVTEKSVEDVEKRLRAAPRERRLSGVFTAELARRLLPPR
jgi:hypothetical protein